VRLISKRSGMRAYHRKTDIIGTPFSQCHSEVQSTLWVFSGIQVILNGQPGPSFHPRPDDPLSVESSGRKANDRQRLLSGGRLKFGCAFGTQCRLGLRDRGDSRGPLHSDSDATCRVTPRARRTPTADRRTRNLSQVHPCSWSIPTSAEHNFGLKPF
jgi:hypothetical protein